MKKKYARIEGLNIPSHVAIILDGNGRWAKAKGMPRNYGHLHGAKAVEDILSVADDMGIKYLTVYAFSTENWNRPAEEVEALMKILRKYMKNCLEKSNKNNVCCRVIGDKSKLDEDLRARIRDLEEGTKNNTGLHFNIAINYGGRDEIIRAVKGIAKDVAAGKIMADDIDEKMLNDSLDLMGMPDPDLLIRTCNEQRISNFLLWELAYSELYFTEVAWPDFDDEELMKAIEAYNHRERKFGKTSDQLVK